MQRAALALCTLLLAPVIPAAAQMPTSQPPLDEFRKPSISGEVRTRDGGRLEQPVTVKLQTIGGTTAAQSWTASTGRFEFYRVPQGQYVLVVDANGFLPLRERVDYFIAPLEGIVLHLTPEASNDAPVIEGAVNVGMLKVPGKAMREFEKGLALLGQRKNVESVAHFQKAIEHHRGFEDAYLQLCLAYLRQRNVIDAEKTLEAAIAASPSNWRAHNLLGRIYRRQKKYEEAVVILRRSLEMNEASWMAHVEMTESLAGLERFEEMAPHAARAHELNPGEPSIHQLYYNSLVRRGDYRAAVAELDEFLQLFPQHSLATRARQQRDALLKELARNPQ